jgi:hypothetical protein
MNVDLKLRNCFVGVERGMFCPEDSDRSPDVEDLFGGKGLGFTANAVVQRMAFTLDL